MNYQSIINLTTVAALALVFAGVPLHAQETAEAARVRQVHALMKERERFAREDKTAEWQARDAQIKRLPAPADPHFAALLVGRWRSPRHDYLYRKDGTWVMLPDEDNNTHGRWHIDGNKVVETVEGDNKRLSRDTLILLNDKENVFTDGEVVFYRTRLGR